MIYVTLSINRSMNIYPDNKVSRFKVNLPETLQVDPEHWEVALNKIQFPHLWYNVRNDKNYFIGWCSTVIGHLSNKRIEFKFMKEIKAGNYSTMSEMVAELKIPTGLDNINCHLDGFDICIDYDSFSNKFIVTMSYEVSIKLDSIKGDSKRMKFCVESPFMTNMKWYTALYVYTDIIQNQLIGALLLRIVSVKSSFGDTTCVTMEL